VFQHATIESRQQEERAKPMSISVIDYDPLTNSEVETKSAEHESMEPVQHNKGV
jgi:hypothetical protein